MSRWLGRILLWLFRTVKVKIGIRCDGNCGFGFVKKLETSNSQIRISTPPHSAHKGIHPRWIVNPLRVSLIHVSYTPLTFHSKNCLRCLIHIGKIIYLIGRLKISLVRAFFCVSSLMHRSIPRSVPPKDDSKFIYIKAQGNISSHCLLLTACLLVCK
jgi:hypothetical protein